MKCRPGSKRSRVSTESIPKAAELHQVIGFRLDVRSGFTLVEILVVMAISVLLIGLIVGPVVQSFNLTKRAQVMIAAQNTARYTLERISREISEAMFVYDNTNSPMIFPIPDWSTDGRIEERKVYGAKIDLVLPRLVMHCNDPNHPPGEPRDYDSGNEAWRLCPASAPGHLRTNVEARPASPRRPSEKIVRYFVGLKDNDPAKRYINSYDKDSGQSTNPDPDNPFLLYRVEFSLNDARLVPQGLNGPQEREDYLLGRTEQGQKFFYDNSPSLADPSVPVWQQWKSIARVVGPSIDVDFARVKWDRDHRPIEVESAIRFMPMAVDNDTLAATYVSDEDAEMPQAIPTSFRASNGLWCRGYRVIVYTGDYGTYYNTDIDPVSGDEWIYRNGTMPVWNIDGYRRTGNMATGTQELMFVPDPDRGMVSFAFPSRWTISPDQIKAINADFHTQYDASLQVEGRGQGIRRTWIGPLIGDGRIVPGSEIIEGPDMTPGPSYGKRVRYQRVPWNLGDPGRNQYKINYELNENGQHEIQFSSLPDEDLPEVGQPLEISFLFCNNRSDMVVKADYSTKMTLAINLAMRLYDDASGKLHVVELSNKIRLRNAMR